MLEKYLVWHKIFDARSAAVHLILNQDAVVAGDSSDILGLIRAAELQIR